MPEVDLSSPAAARAGSQPLRGYLATPSGEGPWPGVVVLHEVFGMNDVVRRQADRLADLGYLALAVDLFSQGGAARCLVSTMRASMTGKGRAYADIAAARDHLLALPGCTGKTGIIGFCLGGGFALMTAASGDYAAAAVNYAHLPPDPLTTLAGACPIVGSFGGRDLTLRGAAAQLDTALTTLGVEHDVKEYPEANHAFLNDDEVGPGWLRPLWRVAGIGPHPAAAADAWARIEGYFRAHLH
ncbi:dienelactone hydrolase family protein [Actinokineospora spheciospongiae]|uniref:dienelactone hydrolase family protein n=1 Tax=Actinokineospora spheciospongiae TaxID=909613 RepID=UPI000D71AFE2|nr:dienelactone hydrolase family protein [Actinokineospora spheciospongiae]PWW66787.1 carboxymethylenebutenolidase [Actinokineospora spheciospongiae]